jgi:4-hydroxy 2-oxovalerate aldolase
MHAPSDIHVLDCTLRDGGYYTNWDFPPELVSNYLNSISAAKVDTVEIGFRFLPQDRYLGAFAYSLDDFIVNLSIPSELAIAVMINASDLISRNQDTASTVNQLFTVKSSSPIDLVRIAVSFRDSEYCLPIAHRLKELGYRVSINLMQAGNFELDQLGKLAKQICQAQCADIVYLADSLGNMTTQQTCNCIQVLKTTWGGQIGVHTHDNLGLALANCLEGVKAGATWVDGTVLGMGRGAGNVRLEYLLVELKKHGFEKYYPDAVFPLVIEDFERLRSEYKWGPNLLYYLSASYGIHPTYVQELLGRGHYEAHHIVSALEFLKKSQASAYDSENLARAVSSNVGLREGKWSAKNWAKDRTILVIGPGPAASRHIEAICRFAKRAKPIVICLNTNPKVPSEIVTAYAACHSTRLLLDADKYQTLNKPIILPLGNTPETIRSKLDGVEIYDYGMEVMPNTFSVRHNSCTLPYSLVAAYVLALATAAGAKDVLLAGFDGYDPSDYRQTEMLHVLETYLELPDKAPLLAVTPTTYNIPQSSIYSPSVWNL